MSDFGNRFNDQVDNDTQILMKVIYQKLFGFYNLYRQKHSNKKEDDLRLKVGN